MELLAQVSYKLPHMVIGVITRTSIRKALVRGISARQIIDYLEKHAHPQVPPCPPLASVSPLALRLGRGGDMVSGVRAADWASCSSDCSAVPARVHTKQREAGCAASVSKHASSSRPCRARAPS
jgi:hypothetical protein